MVNTTNSQLFKDLQSGKEKEAPWLCARGEGRTGYGVAGVGNTVIPQTNH